MTFLPLKRSQWIVLLSLLAAFSILNFAAVSASEGPARGLGTMFGAVLGPMTGAISRGFQGCCYQFSLSLLPFFLPFPLTALALQCGARPEERNSLRFLRSLAWILGWSAWFFGGLVSFGHALS